MQTVSVTVGDYAADGTLVGETRWFIGDVAGQYRMKGGIAITLYECPGGYYLMHTDDGKSASLAPVQFVQELADDVEVEWFEPEP